MHTPNQTGLSIAKPHSTEITIESRMKSTNIKSAKFKVEGWDGTNAPGERRMVRAIIGVNQNLSAYVAVSAGHGGDALVAEH